MEQLQALEDAQDAAESAKKPVPEEVTKKEEDEGPRRIKARDRDQRCAACRCEARGLFAASFFFALPPVRRRRHDDAGMEPTYAHTCVKGIKLAAGELSDSTEEEEVEAMEMYARLAEAEDPRDFEQTLQEARKRALQEENEIQQSIETLEELAREHVNDSLAVMEYRYELRQMSKFGFLSGLISAPRAHVERNVAKAVLQGSPKNRATALMVLSTFPPVRYSVSPTPSTRRTVPHASRLAPASSTLAIRTRRATRAGRGQGVQARGRGDDALQPRARRGAQVHRRHARVVLTPC